MLAIALQVWEGDVYIAKSLVDLICRIESAPREDIEFVLSARRGTNKHACRDIMNLAEKTFPSTFIQGKRFGAGWPEGPNDLWAETMMRLARNYEEGRIKSDGVLTFEADCIPMRPDWLNLLSQEWESAKANGKSGVGHFHTFEGLIEPGHMNGNAIFHAEIVTKYPELRGSNSRHGWDAWHGKLIMSFSQDSNLIYQRYRMDNITREEFEAIRKNGERPALFHGLKNGIGIPHVEAMMKDGSFYDQNHEPGAGSGA